MSVIDYNGTVILGSQEGGYAESSIDLEDMQVKEKYRFGEYDTAQGLADLIRDTFEIEKGSGRNLGDKIVVPRLRIRIEEL